MAIGNVEFMCEYFSKHARMGTARMKLDKEVEEKCNIRVSMEKSNAARKKEVPTGLNYSSGLPSPRVATPRGSGWITSRTYPTHIIHPQPLEEKKYDNNKHDMSLLYLRWKKVQLNSINKK